MWCSTVPLILPFTWPDSPTPTLSLSSPPHSTPPCPPCPILHCSGSNSLSLACAAHSASARGPVMATASTGAAYAVLPHPPLKIVTSVKQSRLRSHLRKQIENRTAALSCIYPPALVSKHVAGITSEELQLSATELLAGSSAKVRGTVE